MKKENNLTERFIELCKKYDIEVSERKEGEYPEIKGAVFLTPDGPKDFVEFWKVSNKYLEEEINQHQNSFREYMEKRSDINE